MKFIRRLTCAVALALVWATAYLQLGNAQFRVREEMISMRDGVKLAVSIYMPEQGTGPWPVILSRTPYGKDAGEPGRTETRWTQNGYVRVLQDSRGKFKSEGTYQPFANDLEDGYDTVEWIAKQPWSNGKVGIMGGSALGIASYNAAMSKPPHLVAGFVTVANAMPQPTGGVAMQHLEDWSPRQGVSPRQDPRPTIRDFATIGPRDFRRHYGTLAVPFYNVGGYYDIFEQGLIEAYSFLQTHGSPSILGKNKLVLGAFGHGAISGDLQYPLDANSSAAVADALPWFDYWLKGIANGVLDEPPVKYFVMGDTLDKSAPGNVWKTADAWPPKSTATPYYFAAQGRLATTRPSGTEDASFIYDPRDPVPTIGGNNLGLPRGPMDQRPIGNRADVLKFESQPLTQPLEVVGPLSADLEVATDAADTDFTVKLIDVYPNGYEAIVNDGIFRLRYVKGLDQQTRIKAGQKYSITVNLWSTALVFNAGHKIAVHVSSSNFPRFERHTNTWDPVMNYDQSVKATNTVFLSGGSRIVLPVVAPQRASSTPAR